jgi:hypothetical protein
MEFNKKEVNIQQEKKSGHTVPRGTGARQQPPSKELKVSIDFKLDTRGLIRETNNRLT